TNLTRAWNQPYFDWGALTARGTPGSFDLYRIPAPTELWTSLTWNRHVINGATSAFNDLDLFLYSAVDGSQLSSSNTSIQNVEQVHAASSGDMVVKVRAFSTTLQGVSSEPYAVAFSAPFNWALGPIPTLSCSGPGSVASGQTFQISCRASNSGDLPA